MFLNGKSRRKHSCQDSQAKKQDLMKIPAGVKPTRIDEEKHRMIAAIIDSWEG